MISGKGEIMKELSKTELKELLIKCWMTHDAMWLMHTVQQCGFEKANTINKAAVRSMAQIEIKRIKKAFGVEKIETPQDFRDMLQNINQVVKADFMDFDYSFPQEDTLRVQMNKCFAHDGVSKFGMLDHYHCGIFERFYGWFDGLGLDYKATPEVDLCIMHQTGSCARDIKVTF
jgi:hypothetical protein